MCFWIDNDSRDKGSANTEGQYSCETNLNPQFVECLTLAPFSGRQTRIVQRFENLLSLSPPHSRPVPGPPLTTNRITSAGVLHLCKDKRDKPFMYLQSPKPTYLLRPSKVSRHI